MKTYSQQEAKGKIQRYCAYQERSHREVRNKLFEYGLSRSDVDELIVDLITDGFLNEERYAKAFAGGKFRMKKWGRLKIINALEAQGLSANCIQSGLREIDAEDYERTLTEFLEKKISAVDDDNIYSKRDRLSKAAILKGYEPELVWKILREIVPDHK
ncbi:RecX family transcriptional regulator [Fulvivirgaceae bacterium PWU4]|uniref:Regulatory protein RecX n=1 Tax=Chryseosolibacter histidini TaxID=2782349 RepID=A0AAP2DN80_9BACT|nr:regulatory protein RecX [Chryseosolibacter histidini]MBT1698569.1 RecX family transcriptional regulator [Chryseosolibacter histidini]